MKEKKSLFGSVDLLHGPILPALVTFMIPIFISCKNGQVLVEELYKLNTVAERFGGDYAKKILIVSDFDKIDAIKTRADEMNIKLIANFDDKKLEKELKNLINN